MLRFRLFGVSIQVDFLFVGLVTLFLLTDRSGMSVIALLVCFIHEAAHLLAFFAVGYTPRALIFELTGIRLVKPEAALTPGRDALVQCAGSAANFLTFLLCSGGLAQINRLSVFAVTHLLLGVFSLLPLRCLDGGKLLELACLPLFGERATQRITALLDGAVTLTLLGMAVYSLIAGERSLTYLFFSGGLFVAAAAKLRRPRGQRAPLRRKNHGNSI